MIVVLNLAILEDFLYSLFYMIYPQLIHRVFIINTKRLTLTIFSLAASQNNSQEIFKLGPRVWNIKDWLLNSFLNKTDK